MKGSNELGKDSSSLGSVPGRGVWHGDGSSCSSRSHSCHQCSSSSLSYHGGFLAGLLAVVFVDAVGVSPEDWDIVSLFTIGNTVC